jgi:hypothetical protein
VGKDFESGVAELLARAEAVNLRAATLCAEARRLEQLLPHPRPRVPARQPPAHPHLRLLPPLPPEAGRRRRARGTLGLDVATLLAGDESAPDLKAVRVALAQALLEAVTADDGEEDEPPVDRSE